MPSVIPRRGALASLAAIDLLPMALLMTLPRIHLSFPKKKKEGAPKEEESAKTVDWGDRKIVLFHDHPVLPRVSILFPNAEEVSEEEKDISVLSDEALIRQMMLEEESEGAPEGVEPTNEGPPPALPEGTPSLEEAIRKAMEEGLEEAEPLEVAKSIVNADGTRDVVLPAEAGPAEEIASYRSDGADSISRGSMVLVEGKKGPATRAVTENLCYGLLENGCSVTYVTTALTVQDFIVEMHAHNYRIARYLPDRQVLVIPVYPLIEGKGVTEGLLDKLITSSQLRTTDAIIVDSLSDFLGGHFDETICMRLLEYLRHLTGTGKTVVLVVEDGQKGIISLRLASDLHFALSAQEGKSLQVKRYQPLKEGSTEVLHFRIDPVHGLISQPRKAVKN